MFRSTSPPVASLSQMLPSAFHLCLLESPRNLKRPLAQASLRVSGAVPQGPVLLEAPLFQCEGTLGGQEGVQIGSLGSLAAGLNEEVQIH